MRIALATLFLLITGCVSTPSKPESSSKDVAEVRAAAESFLQAFDNLDWPAFRSAWSSSSPSVFFPFSDIPRRVDGHSEVERQFSELFEEGRAKMSGPPYFHFAPQELQVQTFGDTALVTFMHTEKQRTSRSTLLFVREANG